MTRASGKPESREEGNGCRFPRGTLPRVGDISDEVCSTSVKL